MVLVGLVAVFVCCTADLLVRAGSVLDAAVGNAVAFVGGMVAFVGGMVAFVGGAVAFVGGAVAFLGGAVAFLGEAFQLVGPGFPLVGEAFPLVGQMFPFVSSAVAFVGIGIAFVGGQAALVGGSVVLGRTDGSYFFEPACGFGGEMTGLRLDGPGRLGLGALNCGAFMTVAGFDRFADRACTVTAGLTALPRRTRMQMRGKRPLFVGSVAQPLSDLLHRGHLLPLLCGRLCIDGVGAAAEDRTTSAGTFGVASRTPGTLLVDVAVALVCSLVAVVAGPFSFVGIAVAVVGIAVTFVSDSLAVVGQTFALVGVAVTPVGGMIALVGDVFAFVGDAFAFVGVNVAFVGDAVTHVRGPVALTSLAHPFVGVDVSQLLEPATSLARHPAKVRGPVAVLGGTLAFVRSGISFSRGGCSFDGGAVAFVGGFACMRGEELASLRCPSAKPRGERACLIGTLPKGQGDSTRSGGLVRFVLPTVVCGGHGSDCTRQRCTDPIRAGSPQRLISPLGSSDGAAGVLAWPIASAPIGSLTARSVVRRAGELPPRTAATVASFSAWARCPPRPLRRNL